MPPEWKAHGAGLSRCGRCLGLRLGKAVKLTAAIIIVRVGAVAIVRFMLSGSQIGLCLSRVGQSGLPRRVPLDATLGSRVLVDVFPCVLTRQLSPVGEIENGQEPADMILHGRLGYPDLRGDLRIAETFGNEKEDLPLAGTQPIRWMAVVAKKPPHIKPRPSG